jgi:hypothetical protein
VLPMLVLPKMVANCYILIMSLLPLRFWLPSWSLMPNVVINVVGWRFGCNSFSCCLCLKQKKKNLDLKLLHSVLSVNISFEFIKWIHHLVKPTL